MNELIEFVDNEQTMSSLEISEITGKPHNDVMKAIRAMEPAWEKISQGKFSLSSRKVVQPNGGVREYPCYELTKTECLYVATKFNDEARAKLVLRWKSLESNERQARPKTQAEIILAQAQQLVEQEKRMVAIENKQQAIEEKVSEIAARTKTDVQYSTIVGFASRYGIKVPLEKASQLGIAASNICRSFGLETGRIPDPRFGSVKTYPDSVLYDVFEKYYPSVRFR